MSFYVKVLKSRLINRVVAIHNSVHKRETLAAYQLCTAQRRSVKTSRFAVLIILRLLHKKFSFLLLLN